jgi:hypothetical protein
MVHVEVGEEDIDSLQPCGQTRAKSADPGARIEDENRAIAPIDLHTCGITAVPDCLRPGISQ